MLMSQSCETSLDVDAVKAMTEREKLSLFWKIEASLSENASQAELDQFDADINYLTSEIGYNPFADPETPAAEVPDKAIARSCDIVRDTDVDEFYEWLFHRASLSEFEVDCGVPYNHLDDAWQ